ncbi:MAG: twin-arginine translocase TatA/TatE family subunit [Calditrichaceae bacterium]|nr:twin-arginine translocase TatA/TatE family subunit [Calditrichaceae bacterium]MBN2709615.1 twin-arginine translocase TatA/TatE family subunit [Calditrichaceae bacterium]RQV92412.1 MAG: twin-arginine translocase TatA/TatE family subunit [Calditrichota bacterium]
MSFGVTEILIIFFIILILFGAKRIPDLAKSLGSSIKSFKKGIQDQEEEDKEQSENK